MNASGNVIESYRYDVFGALTNINYSNYNNRFLFTGREYLKKAFEIDLNWRMAALEDEDLKLLWELLDVRLKNCLTSLSNA
jgi:hypothetical protein